jgi:hypothetical protein
MKSTPFVALFFPVEFQQVSSPTSTVFIALHMNAANNASIYVFSISLMLYDAFGDSQVCLI